MDTDPLEDNPSQPFIKNIMVKSIIQRSLEQFGYRLCRIPNPDDEAIDPTERNQQETLEQLWSDENFKKRYLSEHRLNLYRAVIDEIKERVEISSSTRILDVGSGPGFFVRELLGLSPQPSVAGCDFSEAAVAAATKACPNAEFFRHDIYDELPRDADVVVCMETLEHLFQPAQALANLARHSSMVILTVPEGRKDSFRGHINFWSPESWKVFLEDVCPDREVISREINEGKNLLGVIH